MGAFFQDLRYGTRMLFKHPGLAAISILALGLGLGLTTTMWSINYGALMRGLPFEESERLIHLERANVEEGIDSYGVPIHDYLDWRAAQQSFEDLGAFYNGTVNLSGTEGRPERFDGGFMSASSLALLRVSPVLGRLFRPEETVPGAAPTVILGYDLWQQRFNGDPRIVGTTVRANGETAEIIGVMPRGFKFPTAQGIWLPLRLDPGATPRGRGQFLEVYGRLKPGTTEAQALAEFETICRRIAEANPASNKGVTPLLKPFTEEYIGEEPTRMLWTMMGAVFAVLLIACSNVANLLLARAAVRTREVAVRTALGASRWRIVSQLLAESLVLSLCGALLGIGIAWVGVTLFNNAIVDTNPPFWIDIKLDGPVLLFVLAATLMASLVAGVLPALQATGGNLHEVLKDESRGSSSMRVGKFSKGLVIVEIALSCGLLVGAGFMIQSVVQLSRFDYGVPTRSVFTARLGLFETTYPDSLSRQNFWNELVRRLEALPGQQGVTLTSNLPGLGSGANAVAVEGRTYAAERDYGRARVAAITPGYFRTFRVDSLEGRLLGPGDRGGTLPVAVVTQSFAHRFFPGQSAVGRRVQLGGKDSKEPWRTIVGVIPNVWYQGTDTDNNISEALLVPIAQGDWRFLSIAVAAPGDPMALTDAVRNTVIGINPDQPIYFVRTLQKAIDDNGWFYSVFGTLFMVFGFAALFLATIGVYGVMSFAVSRRTQEVGVRMALGAGTPQVLRLFMRQGVIQVSAGVVLGLGLALLLSSGLEIVLFQVDTKNPLMFAGVMTVLALTGLLATFIPARRATKVDPMVALRYE